MNIVYNVINYYIIDKSFMNLIFFLFFKCINYMLHWLSYYCSLLHLGLLVSNIYIYNKFRKSITRKHYLSNKIENTRNETTMHQITLPSIWIKKISFISKIYIYIIFLYIKHLIKLFLTLYSNITFKIIKLL